MVNGDQLHQACITNAVNDLFQKLVENLATGMSEDHAKKTFEEGVKLVEIANQIMMSAVVGL